jgi:hypothetical protein
MSNEELKRTVEASRSVREELESSPEKALAFLVELGIATPSGELTEPYKRSA